MFEFEQKWKDGCRNKNVFSALICGSDMLRLSADIIEKFNSDVPAWPLYDNDALAMCKYIVDPASQHSFVYMLLAASLHNHKHSCLAAEKILTSAALQDEEFSREVVILSPDMYSSTIPGMWDVWCNYTRSPCFYRLSFHALSSERMITSVAASRDKTLFSYTAVLQAIPNILEHDVLYVLFSLGTLSMALHREDVVHVIDSFRHFLRSNTKPLVNMVGNAIRKNRFGIDIWHHAYYFLHRARVPIHHSVVTYNFSDYQESQSLHIICPNGVQNYMRQNGSKDLLVAALRHVSHASSNHSAYGVAFAKLVLEAYTNNFSVQKQLCERVIHHVDDLASIEYAVLKMIPDLSFQVMRVPFFTSLGQNLIMNGNLQFFMYLCTYPKCEVAVKNLWRTWTWSSSLTIDLKQTVLKHIQWSKSSRRHWLGVLFCE